MRTLTPILFIFTLLNCYSVYAHSGRTDANGGHYDRKTGKYHYHNSGKTNIVEDWETPTNNTTEPEPINIQEQATTDARSHLSFNTNMDVTWYAAGFFLNVFGIGTAYFLTPDVPVTHLVGKSSKYIETYTRVYQSEMKKRRLMKATQGCLASSLLIFYYYRLKTGRTFY